ncbi:MAG: FAD-dependent thymidylate synthase [Verrucomicrobia bacterium]|nr:FAD-dependent thymidylate synthase [Verrucomicrobiota bacterium]
MKVTQVSICQTEAAAKANAPALTPELLAASGARYSRDNEGLDMILSRIDPANLDKSVDGIFRMIDYGHQSIADMAPVAMFMDGMSQWLAYTIWSLCPLAGGQESSTRYIELGAGSIIPPSALGIPESLQDEWSRCMSDCMQAYNESLDTWTGLSQVMPELTRIPKDLLSDPSEKAQKKIQRMRRNYGFDRARYYLTAAVQTNVMMVMSARAWATLCQYLSSHPLPEPRELATRIREQLLLCAPRLIKHADAKSYTEAGIAAELAALSLQAQNAVPPHLAPGALCTDCPPSAHLEITPPHGATGTSFVRDLTFHENRYAWIGASLKRTAVRFAWDAVALAELRDLNRHRTGTKFCPMRPLGFYSALDELPRNAVDTERTQETLLHLNEVGRHATLRAHELLAAGDPTYVYWLPLGAQLYFEHLTTADKFIYEAELRTGVGAHYRYARHLHDALAIWYKTYPETRTFILEGTAEPE